MVRIINFKNTKPRFWTAFYR